MGRVIRITVLLLALLVITAGITEAGDVEDLEIEQLMEIILESSSEVISSEPNVTPATQLLAALPEPEKKTKIAVYDIADKTGQVKDYGASVVTQGATDMLITALQRSRQFVILDRTNFGDFMNEQNLKSQDRLAPGEDPQVSNMTGASYVLSGAITEYQVDKDTGGLGISVAGIGGSQKHARASTAIDLRIINTTTGEVVWSESLKKEIRGKKVGVQAFSFLGNNIVEFETGKGMQEVINLVVRTLLEEAVFIIYDSNVL